MPDKKMISELLKEALAMKTCIDYAVAAVIETVHDEQILGWNGPPEGIRHTRCYMFISPPELEDLYNCVAVHAERRVISRAARDGIETRGGTMYMSDDQRRLLFPCSDCAKSIIEAGIEKLVVPDEFYADQDRHILVPQLQNSPYNFEMAEEQLRLKGVILVVDASIRPEKF